MIVVVEGGIVVVGGGLLRWEGGLLRNANVIFLSVLSSALIALHFKDWPSVIYFCSLLSSLRIQLRCKLFLNQY